MCRIRGALAGIIVDFRFAETIWQFCRIAHAGAGRIGGVHNFELRAFILLILASIPVVIRARLFWRNAFARNIVLLDVAPAIIPAVAYAVAFDLVVIMEASGTAWKFVLA